MKTKVFIFPLLIGIILVVSTWAYFSFFSQSSIKKFLRYPTQNTISWKTYTNSFYKFSFKYPKNWTGPFRVSGNEQQGQVAFQGKEGAVLIE